MQNWAKIFTMKVNCSNNATAKHTLNEPFSQITLIANIMYNTLKSLQFNLISCQLLFSQFWKGLHFTWTEHKFQIDTVQCGKLGAEFAYLDGELIFEPLQIEV